MNPSVAIIVPSIGTPYLKKCLDSIKLQDYKNIVIYIAIDGAQYNAPAIKILDQFDDVNTIFLSKNIGKGWYGHRIYAASSFLVNEDIICYLDEDNWLESHHVSSLLTTMLSKNVSWSYSLRNIYNKNGEYLCSDNCESLGIWPTFFDENIHHIDTSCYAIKRELALKVGHNWYGQWGADRQFFQALKVYAPNFSCTGQHTLNYRLDGNPASVKSDFFLHGNALMNEKYDGNYPWLKKIEI